MSRDHRGIPPVDNGETLEALMRVRQLVADMERKFLVQRMGRWFYWRSRIAHWLDKMVDGTMFVLGIVGGLHIAFWLGWLPVR